ncbi:poly [ADP-ribose] polymerase-like [Plodia interpunctella]|uniref:poly [ADP-ribose] polymerase-like n=1 Tax=Plodia interpunctella TaxID=58824 RepID=UPI0023679DAD|nr:poly [ADP-ribose] polymerase-like [Plodia interpunctella]
MFSSCNLPYRVDRAKTGLSKCVGCKTVIPKETLRMARMFQFKFGKMREIWYHMECFFEKQRPKSVCEIDNFNNIDDEDQLWLTQKVDEVLQAASVICNGETNGQATKRSSSEVVGPLTDFSVELSKSFRAKCRGCDIKICKGELRISKTSYDTDIAILWGKEQLWYHVICFEKARKELQYFAGGDMLPGFNELPETDQQNVRDNIRPIASDEVPIKKIKNDPEEQERQREMSEQNNLYQSYKSKLKNLSQNEIVQVLKRNGQFVPKNKQEALELLADCLAFGALQRCAECRGQLLLASLGYRCSGFISAFSSCGQFVSQPVRFPLTIPPELAQKPPLLGYEPTVGVRLFRNRPHPTTATKEIVNAPLKNMQFFIYGRELKDRKDDIKKCIFKMGGLVVTKLTDTMAAVISTRNDMVKKAEIAEKQIEVVEESFLDQIDKENGTVMDSIKLIGTCNIADWGSDPINRVPPAVIEGKHIETCGNNYKKPSTSTQIITAGSVIESAELARTSHVFRDREGDAHCARLSQTDLVTGTNVFYKLQLLESDDNDRYYVYTAWGQIGNDGLDNIKYFDNLESAMVHFKSKYFKLTKNKWEDRHDFVKHPYKYYPHDVNYNDANTLSSLEVNWKSDLPISVQRLMQMIFDIDTMKLTLQHFELDTEKLPLGKLSQKQLDEGFKVLMNLYKYVEKGKVGRSKILAESSHFYTLIPHKSSRRTPPVLDSMELVQDKMQVLDDLMQIELAYTLRNEYFENRNYLEECYKKLNTDITPLNKNSNEFNTIEEYVRNTHASTHWRYSLEIEQVFRIVRSGEDARYLPFKGLHNRRLLWHGSRVTSFVGILSHGLVLPRTFQSRLMFGKGIYFTDMVSKSANYCFPSKESPVGLLLLCEVALGNMKECTEGECVSELPPGIQAVVGLGRAGLELSRVRPGPAGGALLPLSPPVFVQRDSSLDYNEFVVYDEAQVNIKYLLQVKFNFNY